MSARAQLLAQAHSPLQCRDANKHRAKGPGPDGGGGGGGVGGSPDSFPEVFVLWLIHCQGQALGGLKSGAVS